MPEGRATITPVTDDLAEPTPPRLPRRAGSPEVREQEQTTADSWPVLSEDELDDVSPPR
jgi:hypothetical protein